MLNCRSCRRVAVVFLCGLWLAPPARAADEGFADLLNGKDLSGWVVEGSKTYQDGKEKKPIWSVEDGMITAAGRGYGFLRYDKKQYGDFLLHIEYRMSKGCNSGIGIRTVPFTGKGNTRPSAAAYEIQILDDAGKKPNAHSSGSLYRYIAPKVNASKPAGEWNAIDIECRGPKIHITLNGQVIHDLDQSKIDAIKDKPLSGYVCVQSHTKRIEYRVIRIKDL